jgi:hypothetical protein
MRARPTIEGPYSIDPHDAWAPVILPTLHYAEMEDNYLQAAMNSLGYPQTLHWRDSLRLANVLSLGTHITIPEVAQVVGIEPDEVSDRMADLRSLFGPLPQAALIDRLCRERFLEVEVQYPSPKLEPSEAAALAAAGQGTAELASEVRERLGRQLDCPPASAAIIRRAYERGLRVPLGLQARSLGFHLLPGIPVPDRYPGQPRVQSDEKLHWNLTKTALRGKSPPGKVFSRVQELSPADLATAGLKALGCDRRAIGARLGVTFRTVNSYLKSTVEKMGALEIGDAIDLLFDTDTFFATEPVESVTGDV